MEERFDLAQAIGDDGAELRIVGRDFERRIDEKAAAALPIADRARHDVLEEAPDRPLGRQRLLESLDAGAGRGIEIVLESAREQIVLVAEGVVEARSRYPHRGREVAHRCRLIPVLPEAVYRGLQCHGLIEFARSGHSVRPSGQWSSVQRDLSGAATTCN